LLVGNLDGDQFRSAAGILQRANDVLGGKLPHDQCQVTLGGRLDLASINPLHVFRSATTTNYFHHKFCIRHRPPVFLPLSAIVINNSYEIPGLWRR
jgi:hypothetical protein